MLSYVIPHTRRFTLTVLYICFISTSFCYAQEAVNDKKVNLINTNYHKRKVSFPPKAILVQLRSEERRIKYFSDHDDEYEANQLRKEASIVRRVMKNDFEDHFTFCPVYYFIDTNYLFIKEQQFENVLFTAEGLPITNCVIKPGDTNYYIVYYGYPEEQMEIDAIENLDFNIGKGEVMGKGLIFLNYKYRQKDFYYKFGYWDLLRKLNSKYEYRSSRYDIDYFPFAEQYENDLREVYDPQMKNKGKARYR